MVETEEKGGNSASAATPPSGSDEKPESSLPIPKPKERERQGSMRGYRGSGYVQSEKTTCSALPIPPDQVAFLGRILTTETGYTLYTHTTNIFLEQNFLPNINKIFHQAVFVNMLNH